MNTTSARTEASLVSPALAIAAPALLVGLVVSGIACAAAPAADSVTLQEIVVTATRREESVQRVPISITAVGADELTAGGIKSIEEIGLLAPGVQYAIPNGYSSAITTIAMRGLNSNTGPSTVGIYLDDMPISSRASVYTNQGSAYPFVFDLNRVEVARGPQGTLFGAGSEAGTLRFISNAPSLTDYSGVAHGEVASTEGGRLSYETGLAIGGPIVKDEVGFRFSAWNRQDGGYVDRVDPVTGNIVTPKANSVGKTVVRGALAFRLNENVLISSSVYYQNVRQDDAQRFYAAFSNADQGTFHNGVLLPEAWRDHWVLPSVKLEAHLPFAEFTATASYLDRDVTQLLDQSAFVCPSLGPTGCGNPLGIGYPNSLKNIAYTPTGLSVKAWTAEARLASNKQDAHISWVAGLFYDHRVQHDFQTSYDQDLVPAAPNLLAALFQDQHETFTDEQFAVFAQADWHITDALTATLGERVSNVKVTVEEFTAIPPAGAPADTITSSKETSSSPRVALSYQLNSNNLFYASFSKGFRVGGANAPVPLYCPQVVPPTYASDYVQAYEVGAKNTFFDRRVQIDTSVFHLLWKNIQQFISLQCGPFGYGTNAGSAVSNGLDLSLHAIVTDRVRVNLNVSYVDAYYDTSGYDKSGNILVGKDDKVGILPQVNAPWTVNASVDYDFPLGDGDKLHARAEGNYSSRSPGPFITQLVNSSNTYPLALPDPPTYLYNARVGYKRKKMDVTLFINNVFNNTPRLSKYQGISNSDLITYTTFRPRTVGLSASYDF